MTRVRGYLLAGALLAASGGALASRRWRPDPAARATVVPPRAVPRFRMPALTSRGNDWVDHTRLLGRVWVADVVFTHCVRVRVPW